jgi:hypothetical protein
LYMGQGILQTIFPCVAWLASHEEVRIALREIREAHAQLKGTGDPLALWQSAATEIAHIHAHTLRGGAKAYANALTQVAKIGQAAINDTIRAQETQTTITILRCLNHTQKEARKTTRTQTPDVQDAIASLQEALAEGTAGLRAIYMGNKRDLYSLLAAYGLPTTHPRGAHDDSPRSDQSTR